MCALGICTLDGNPCKRASGRPVHHRPVGREHRTSLTSPLSCRAHPGAGVAGQVIRRLLRDADASALPVTCDVVIGNDAQGFWQHLGFRAPALSEAGIWLWSGRREYVGL